MFGSKPFPNCSPKAGSRGDDTVLVQLATPSRERVDSYRILRNEVEQQVGHINGESTARSAIRLCTICIGRCPATN